MNPENIARLAPNQRLRALGHVYGQEAVTRARVELHRAELTALAIDLGTQLLDSSQSTLRWTGGAVEPLLAGQRRRGKEPWPVNVESDLLRRVRAASFDLGDLLEQHRRDRAAHPGLVSASVGFLPGGEGMAIMTVHDPASAIEASYLFSLKRTPA